MSKAIIKILLLASFVVFVLYLIIRQFNLGYTDPYYIRLTTPKASSLIIGTSRAAQGIKPSVLNNALQDYDYEGPFQNFSFTIAHSPYGNIYLDFIKKKLDTTSRKGIFVVTVDPWALSFLSEGESAKSGFREGSTFVNSLESVDTYPNFEYLFNHFHRPYYTIFFSTSTDTKLHKDGWLEIDVDNSNKQVEKRKKVRIEDYEEKKNVASISIERINSLNSTISFLENYGNVYLVRIPISTEMVELENSYSPNFDSLMLSIANKYKIPYLNYIKDSEYYETTDGNHLYKDAAHSFTERLSKDIIKHSLSQ